jgi:hypothetical protein
VRRRGGRATVRIPWALLGFADPSSRRISVPRHGGTAGTRRVGGVVVTVARAGAPVLVTRRITWAAWNRVRWRERRKAGWPVLRRAFTSVSG